MDTIPLQLVVVLSWLAVGVMAWPGLFLALDSAGLESLVPSVPSAGEQQAVGPRVGLSGRQLVSSVDTKVFNLSRY